MDNLKGMLVFYHVADSGSFAAAARQLGVARSAVSKHISRLEQDMGVRLLNRTTRSLSLTEAGQSYFESCQRIVEEMETAWRTIGALRDHAQGNLKIAAPIHLGNRYIAPMLHDFMRQHEQINAELLLDDQVLDMVDNGIDISVRIGWLEDSALVARSLGEWPRYVCASPEYIARHGLPESPEELSQHEWIMFTRLPTPAVWTFSRGDEQVRIQVKGRFRTNNADAVRNSMIAGMGIAAQAAFMVDDDLREGRLVRLLPEYECGAIGMHAVYQSRRYQQAKVRLFLDFLSERLGKVTA